MTYLQPVFAVLLVITIAALWRNAERWRRLALPVSILLFLYCWPPAAFLPMWLLEHPHSENLPADKSVQAIVVLASDVLPPAAPGLPAGPGQGTYDRCTYAAWLYEHGFAVPIFVSGGGDGRTPPYAFIMRDLMVNEGVPRDVIATEASSRSTAENAANTAALLRSRGIRKVLLVTEAFHMTRAARCFEKLGFSVVPAACRFRSRQQFTPSWLLPGSLAIASNDAVVHEAIGLLWYKITGRI